MLMPATVQLVANFVFLWRTDTTVLSVLSTPKNAKLEWTDDGNGVLFQAEGIRSRIVQPEVIGSSQASVTTCRQGV